MPIPRPRRVLTALALTGALTAAAVPAFADKGGGEPDPGKAAMSHAERAAAVGAVERAEALLEGTSSADPRSATMALREVRMLRDSLPADLRERAAETLSRPTDEGGTWLKDCATAPDVCVHYLQGADVGGGEYTVADVAATVQEIHDDYIAAGYREPLPDGGFGGSEEIDVYLEDLGDESLYGYCTSDDPKQASSETGWDVWAYCAFDDDFSAEQFPSNTPLENMQVTAAHEYFHATQFAYDAWEDSWILEATATWAEDELYDEVDDNHNYNGSGPIAHPTTPLDSDQSDSLFKYGAWTFFRYLTEMFPAEQGGVPTLVRKLWERMDGSVGGPDRYSLQAVQEVLGNNDTSLAAAFAGYSLANRAPGQSYDEGAAYPTAPAKSVTVSSKSNNPGAFTKTLDHLTSSTVRYRPSNLTATNWRLRLKLNLAPKAKGSAAAVTVVKKNGARTLLGFAKLNAAGDATVSAPFSSAKVAAVEVTLLNLSSRLNDCWNGDTPYSCGGGDPLDDNLRQLVDPVAYRP